jgi:hypothetical protein
MRKSLSESTNGTRELLQRLDSVRRFDALKPISAHEMRHHLPKARLVVDDQAIWRCCGSGHGLVFSYGTQDARLSCAHL